MPNISKTAEKNNKVLNIHSVAVFRKIFGLSQYDISIETKIHQSRLSLLERGYVKPKKKEKEAIADALGVQVEDIDWDVQNF